MKQFGESLIRPQDAKIQPDDGGAGGTCLEQFPESLFAFGKDDLRFAALRNILGTAHKAVNFPAFVMDWKTMIPDPADRPIGTDNAEFLAEPDAIVNHLFVGAQQSRMILRMNCVNN